MAVPRLLHAHHPYPGVAIDRAWNVMLSNAAAVSLTAGLPPDLLGPPLNVYRVCLHPDGLSGRTVNFAEWAGYLLSQLRRSIALTADPGLRAIADEVSAYPNVAALVEGARDDETHEPALLVPLRLRSGGVEVSLFTTLTSFGTPRDVTLDELAVEPFFPADPATEAVLRASAGAGSHASSQVADGGASSGPGVAQAEAGGSAPFDVNESRTGRSRS